MSSKKALKQSQKLAFQKHKANSKLHKSFFKKYKFPINKTKNK